MAKMSQREKEQTKRLLAGLEKLTDMGGFIAEELQEKIYEMYGDNVISITEKYCSLGPWFYIVADAVETAMECQTKYEHLDFDEDDEPYWCSDDEFADWIFDLVAKFESDKVKKGESRFWMDWDLSFATQKILLKFNAVEDRVLYLSKGLDNKKAMNAEEIAALPEFQCEPKYVQKILCFVERELRFHDRCGKEFNQAVEAMKKGGKKDGGYELFS